MDALLLAVLNALWQGVALTALVAAAMRLGLRRNATTACVVWTIAFGVIAALPFVDLASARPPARPEPPPSRELVVAAVVPVREPASLVAETASPATVVHDVVPRPDAFATLRASLAADVDGARVRAGSTLTGLVRAWGTLIVAIWAIAAGTLLLRLGAAYYAVARVKRRATPVDDPLIERRLRDAGHRRRATVASSPDIGVPCAVGFVRPMILVPASLVASLDREDLARVVLHESAHLQRYDDWTNAVEQAICAVQFFQPALYVARRRIDLEREIACDDRVLADAGEPLRYAECLARIVQRQRHAVRVAVAPGFAMRRAHVLARVRRIVDRSRDASPRLRAAAAVAVAVVVVAALGIARLQVPLVAPASATTDAVAAAAPPHAGRLPRVVRVDTLDAVPLTTRVAPLRVARVTPLARPAGKAPLPHVAPLGPNAALPPSARRHVAALRLERVVPLAPSSSSHHAARTTMRDTGEQRVVALVDDRDDLATAVETAPVAAAPTPAMAAQSSASVPPAPPAPTPMTIHVVIPPIPAIPPIAYPVHVDANGMTRTAFSRGGDLLEAIDEAKYPHPSVDELIALHEHGVGGTYVRGMAALGLNRPSLHDMIALADQGIGPTYVRGLLDAGMHDVSASQLIKLCASGVDGTFVRRLAEHGYKNLSVDDLVRLKESGI